ncbi:phage portal protein [Actinospongicola halichondriae]|uniref:phage portal protein n=1 Tax=Actinospongicola halichondriae TaxID=3236844 RepID=UPI003D498A22
MPPNGGLIVNERSALGLSAVWRAVALISGTVAALPVKTYRKDSNGIKTPVPSLLDNPSGVGVGNGQTSYEWSETVLLHLLLHGNAYLLHLRNQAGVIIGLLPLHPLGVSIEEDSAAPERKVFVVALDDGKTVRLTTHELTHIPALSTDGIRGLSPIKVARESLTTSLAGEKLAETLFNSGALVSGMVTPEDDLPAEEARQIQEDINLKMHGVQNANTIRVVNRRLKFSSFSLSAEDAQFLQSRSFQVEEVARWFGTPPHLLMQTEKQTSWGTGIEEQHRALGRHTLSPWANRIEQRLSRLVPRGQFVEYDFAGLERPNLQDELTLLMDQVNNGFLTLNEARAVRNLPPVEGGDALRLPTYSAVEDTNDNDDA